MCGIAGTIGWMTPAQVRAVERMGAAQAHRGPDDAGLWSSRAGAGAPGPGVALGHRRLSVLDLSPLGHQPMVDEPSGCVIVYNGEVYNYRALRDALQGMGVRFRSQTDTEVVLQAYLRWGREALPRLRGMFALAIWDPRKEQLLLARDRMGVKPLYYVRVEGESGSHIYFASELRALLATGEVERKLDPVGLATYLWNGVVVGPHTLVLGCKLLPQGTTLTLGTNGHLHEPDPYWSLPASGADGSAEAVERLQAELRDAVRLRLASDVPLGVFLSGGVDSSAIAALASSGAPGTVTTFHIGFAEAGYDESAHARAVAAQLGTDHREVRLTHADFRAGLPEAMRSLDQPTFDALNTYFVSRAVRRAGLTVALAGTGGDELFGGYPSFRDLPRAREVARCLKGVPDGVLSSAGRALTRLITGPFGEVPPQTRWGKLSDVLLTRGDLVQLYQVSYGLFTESFLRELGADLARAPLGISPSRRAAIEAMIAEQPTLHAISLLESSFFLGERLLRDTDATSMAVSLEVRVPLVDHRILEALATVPDDARFEPLGRKKLLRKLAMPDLDPSLFERPKSGFELPLDVWCRNALQADMASLLGTPEPADELGLDGALVCRLWQAFKDGAPGLYWSRVWSLYTLLWWCRDHGIRR